MKRGALGFIFFLLLFFIGQDLSAEVFRFSADRKSGTRARGRELIVLEGNAYVASDSLVLRANRIEISGDDMQIIECRGNVSGVDEGRGLYFTADELRYDRTQKLTRLSGNSIMEDKKNAIIAKARFIEYNEDLGTSLLQIGVRIFKGDLVCRADHAFWRREEQDLELASSPVVFKGSDEFRAARMRINLDTDELLMEGSVSGRLNTASSEDEKTDTDKAPGLGETSEKVPPSEEADVTPADNPPQGPEQDAVNDDVPAKEHDEIRE